MKSNKYKKRSYRDRVRAKDLFSENISVKETDLQILSDKKIDIGYCRKRIIFYRNQIESYIAKDRRFLTSLKPLAVEINAPFIIGDMAGAARKAGVGPMAAVAGAIAQAIGKDLLKKGAKEVIVENGGDIFLKIKKPRIVGIYAGKQKCWQNLGLRLKPDATPLGICTSSGTVGHSLSFGKADAAVVFAKNCALADAVATAAANRVSNKEDLEKSLSFARNISGIKAVLLVIGKEMIAWGGAELVYRR